MPIHPENELSGQTAECGPVRAFWGEEVARGFEGEGLGGGPGGWTGWQGAPSPPEEAPPRGGEIFIAKGTKEHFQRRRCGIFPGYAIAAAGLDR